MNIQENYGRKNTVGYKSKHGECSDVPLPDWLVGIELEIENFNPEHTQEFGGVTFTTDGSLRETEDGVGIEAITKPIAIKHVEPLLTAFYKKFSINEGNYSERCSTHVHFNVEPLTFEEVGTVCLIYQTVENLLFHYVGNERQNNIFCVPWNQSNITYNIVSRIELGESNEVFRRWQKYSALNLIPITTQGTIEFRHLHGTCDVSLIVHWIYLIAKIFEYAQKVPLAVAQQSIMNMNTVSNYHEWLSMVFGKYAVLLQNPNFERELSRGVIDSKVMLMGKEKPISRKITSATYFNTPIVWDTANMAVDLIPTYTENAPLPRRVPDGVLLQDRPFPFPPPQGWTPAERETLRALLRQHNQLIQPAPAPEPEF